MPVRVRKDIRSLSDEELQIYRAKLDDLLQVGALNSKWQELGRLRMVQLQHVDVNITDSV